MRMLLGLLVLLSSVASGMCFGYVLANYSMRKQLQLIKDYQDYHTDVPPPL